MYQLRKLDLAKVKCCRIVLCICILIGYRDDRTTLVIIDRCQSLRHRIVLVLCPHHEGELIVCHDIGTGIVVHVLVAAENLCRIIAIYNRCRS